MSEQSERESYLEAQRDEAGYYEQRDLQLIADLQNERDRLQAENAELRQEVARLCVRLELYQSVQQDKTERQATELRRADG